jgi:hypothetical protein
VAAASEARNVILYDAITRCDVTALTNSSHVIPEVFRNAAESGSSTMRLR